MKIIHKITEGFCSEVAKRARKGTVAGISFTVFAIIISTILYAQQRGTPSQIRVKIDATGALGVSSSAITNPVTTVVFSNARLRVDSNGYLVVTNGGGSGFAPGDATYILKTTNPSLANAQSLGALTTGLLLNTVVSTTGTLSTYVGTTCTSSVLTALSSLGVGTCSGTVSLSNAISAGEGSVSAPQDASFTLYNGNASQGFTGIFPAHIEGGFQPYGGSGRTGMGVDMYGITNALDQPAIRFEGFNSAASGGSNYTTDAVVKFLAYGRNGTSVTLVSGGILFEFGNFSDTTKSVLFCKTDQANCSTTVSSGTKNYLYDFSRDSASSLKFATGIFTTAILTSTDNTVDIGASGATRPRTGYFGTSLVTPTVNATTAYQVNGTAITSGTTHLSSGSGMGVANVGANSCGTTTATIAGNNNLFTITVGATAGTQCRVAFTVTATNEWGCTANDDTTTVAVRTTPVDTTHVDLIGTFTAGDKVTGICFPR